ncbi:MAG: hypothetical protein GF383_05515 [Candidatus Lokiarchaeota archaeon]|nr:hypothetical protein [Candidatus Lokiarchaeota archaeon]MBD3339372.1 hypothetical protein [Candidatus Lokiarchaeota archaeon]
MFCDTQVLRNEDKMLIEKLKNAKKTKEYSKVEIDYHIERKHCLMWIKRLKIIDIIVPNVKLYSALIVLMRFTKPSSVARVVENRSSYVP